MFCFHLTFQWFRKEITCRYTHVALEIEIERVYGKMEGMGKKMGQNVSVDL